MTYECNCYNETGSKNLETSDCEVCKEICNTQGYNVNDCISKNDGKVLGVGVALFWILLVVQIIPLFLMIWFSINTIKKCKGKPSWLTPVIIILLTLYIFIGWYPFIGLILFITLLTILLIYNSNCR
jgi:hypothetical protein